MAPGLNEMMHKGKETLFICQVTDSSLRVLKCVCANGSKTQISELSFENIPANLDKKELTDKLARIFKDFSYDNNRVILSLPRSKSTCRYLKIPSSSPQEIDNIISLQASRYLPYTSAELITGYEVLRVDSSGYANINLVIVHKDIIEYYLSVLSALKITKYNIVLGSYGLSNLYSFINPASREAVMLVDVDVSQADIAIVSEGKLVFSRYFKFSPSSSNKAEIFINEINKSQDAYNKDTSGAPISKIAIFNGNHHASAEFGLSLKNDTHLAVEMISYFDKLNIAQPVLNKIINSDNSFASIIGLGLKDLPETLDLLPGSLKEKTKSAVKQKESFAMIALVLGIVIMFAIGTAKSLDNKTNKLKELKSQLAKVEKEAKDLGEIEKRFELLKRQSQKKPSSLDVLYALHQILPQEVSLVSFSYEEDSQIVLHGVTSSNNYVFNLVSKLGESEVFKGFHTELRYSTDKGAQDSAGLIDFEVACTKEK